jgi:uncharacterized repeat protein (TIGR02543 family)
MVGSHVTTASIGAAATTSTPSGYGNVTLTAQWSANTYVVTYNTHGGSATSSSSYVFGGSFTLPSAPTRSGYTFTGWFVASSGGTALGSTHTPSTPGDITIYAQWTANSYTVSFDTQGGTSVDALGFDFGDTLTLPAGPTRNGYTFAGWFAGPSGGSAMGSTHTPSSPGNFTLYAHWTANNNNITYDDNGATTQHVGGDSTYATGSEFTLPTAPTRSGFLFAGWQMVGGHISTASIDSLAFTASPNGYGSITLTAQWTPLSYTVTYDDNSPTTAHVGGGTTYSTGGTFTLPTPPARSGYTFTGWQMTGMHVSATPISSLAISVTPVGYGNVILTADWSANSYTVTYDTQGGSSVSSETFLFGNAVTLPTAPTRTGYVFIGWYVTAEDGMPLDAEFTPSTPGDVTIYAQWSEGSYSVTYVDNNADTAHAGGDGTYSTDSPFALPTPPSRAGYEFAGWILTGTHAPTQHVALDSTTAQTSGFGNITLTAQWSVNSYSVNYDSQGGSDVDPSSFVYGTTVMLADAPSRTGYNFLGWFVTPTGGTALSSSLTPIVPGDVTLYAQWAMSNYTITYDSRGGSSVDNTDFYYGDTVTLRGGPIRSGYTFDGWFESASGGQQVDTDFTPDAAENVTLYAHWTANDYLVIFNTQGGSTVGSIGYTWGESVNLPAAPTRTGFVFTGWYVVTSGGTALGSTLTPSMPGDVTLYAQWTPVTFAVRYNANGGTGRIANQTFTYGGSALVVASSQAMSRAGYDFVEWNTSASGTGVPYVAGSRITPTTDVTLYAIWSLTPVPVVPIDPLPTPSPTPLPTPSDPGVNLVTPWAPETIIAATIDLGNGVKGSSGNVSPLQAALTQASAARTVDEMSTEAVDGFKAGSSVVIRVSGARTAGQFVLSDSSAIDTVAVAATLEESTARQETDFAKISDVAAVTDVNWDKVTTGEVTPDATDLFKASGLGKPKTLGSFDTASADHWVEVGGDAGGYEPGSVVYLAVTTDPIIFGSALVDKYGNAHIDGLLPIDVLEPAAHSIRIVGTRDLGGVRVDSNGQIQLSDATMNAIQEFDQGTNAVVEILGNGKSGPHAAVRLIPLEQFVPWWVLWVFLAVLLAAFIWRRRQSRAKRTFIVLTVTGLAGMVVVEIVAWFAIAYVMLPWAPLATAIVLGGELLIGFIQRASRRTPRAETKSAAVSKR